MNRSAWKRHLVGGIALLLLLALVTGCGGSSRLSPSAYRAKLATIGREANKAQAQVEKGLEAKERRRDPDAPQHLRQRGAEVGRRGRSAEATQERGGGECPAGPR